MATNNKNSEELFFELGKLLSICKTPSDQQHLLQKILQKLDADKEHYLTQESTRDDQREVQRQLNRHYEKAFARWGLGMTQKEILITNEFVKKEGKLIAYDDDTKRHEIIIMPHHLRQAFNDGWIAKKHHKAA